MQCIKMFAPKFEKNFGAFFVVHGKKPFYINISIVEVKSMKKMLSLLLAIIMVIGLCPITVFAQQSVPLALENGTGTQEDPYLIYTAEDLSEFRDKVNSATAKSTSTLCAKLMANIDLSSLEGSWDPIGHHLSYSNCVYYGGTFDGNGFTISGLKIDSALTYQALIGYVKGATVKNLTVEGSVKTTTTSSAYAAGIVAYGYPVTMENCTNKAEVTVTQKGYAAGVVAYLYTGSKVSGCFNTAKVTAEGGYVGGIVGTASGVAIEGCFNSGDIVTTGEPNSYTYGIGGIAGGVSGASTVSRCGNTGNIASTIKRAGGVVGSAGGTISSCFNTGNVTGIYSVGGVAGCAGNSNTKITDCYNTGNVICNAPTATFSDSNAKGIGGVIGDASGSSTTGVTLANCYNAGNVTNNDTATAEIGVGGVIGMSAGKNYKGEVSATGLIKAENCYYKAAEGLQGDGYDSSAAGVTSKADDELKAAGMAALLGEAYVDKEEDYPILGWQDPNAEYTVKFVLSPANASLTVKSGEETVAPQEDGSYLLKNGTYTYTVSAPEHDTQNGTFTVAYGGQTITVTLEEKLYDVVFTTVPVDAVLEVSGRTPMADGRTYRLPKSGNPYSYTAKAFGYKEAAGSFNVSGSNDRVDITLDKLPNYTVTFGAITAADGKEISPSIKVTSKEWPAYEISAEKEGHYSLPDGEYAYTVTCSGYKAVNGSFSIKGAAVSIPALTLEVQVAWDGKTYTEPQKNSDGAYLIGSPDELMWFNKNAALTDSATLTANITINEDVNIADKSALYKWTPRGYIDASYKKVTYTGTFDGAGYTISGLYISTSGTDYKANYTGLFGYVGADGKVCNLTVADSLIEAKGTGNRGKYVGAVAGTFDGTMENCHATETVTVTGRGYVGGVVGSLGGTMAKCSSRATVVASETYAGGVAGYNTSSSAVSITECFNAGSVTGSSLVGGVTGGIYSGGTVSKVYNTGTVKATASRGAVGGITGLFRYGTISNAYQCGSLEGTAIGTVAAKLDFANGQKSIEKVFVLQSDYEAVGNLNSCTIQSGEAVKKTSDELKALAPELDGFAADSGNINGGYPVLEWQVSGAQEPEDPDKPASDPAGWDGKTSVQPKQENGIYRIGTAEEFKWFADTVKTDSAVKGVLTADIDLNNRNWNPIGTSEKVFSGELDGAGFEIKNLYCKESGSAALFRGNAGTIKNLKVSGKLIGGDYTAAIASKNSGTISGCTANVNITGGSYTAGIAARNEKDAVITGCSNLGSISGIRYVGGIAGENAGSKENPAKIEKCVNGGFVQAAGFMLGGIAGDNSGEVRLCANNGNIINTAVILRSCTGGCVGRNDGTAESLYNAGCVESIGGCVSGCVGLNLNGSSYARLYNVGDVTGGDYEDDGYPTDNSVSSDEELAEAKKILASELERLPKKNAITGTLAISGKAAVESVVKAEYTGSESGFMYVWYYSYSEGDDAVVAISSEPEYTIPLTMGGRKLRLKVVCESAAGVLSAETEKVEGLVGTVKIEGAAVVGKTIKAVFYSSESVANLKYQWYIGKNPISGADKAEYTVLAADVGKVLTVRVSSADAAGYVEASTKEVKTAEQAGIWSETECSEPANVGGVYQITTEKELHWFASEVNGGNNAISAKLLNDIALTTENWYPIGRSGHAFAGSFDGNGKNITNLKLTSAESETGFFGLILGGGKVSGLHLSGSVTATGDVSQTGGIAGAMDDKESAASITDCSFSGSVSGAIQVGGIVGCVGLNNKVERCANSAAVTGTEQIGGISGANSYGNIRYCKNTGAVGGTSAKYVGGIVGDDQNYAELLACYNMGTVTGSDYVGGIAGNVYVASMPKGCYNAGKVSEAIHCGGAVGSFGGDEYITIKRGSFYLGPLSAAFKANGSTMKTESEMKSSSFVSELNSDAYGKFFVRDIANKNGGFPILNWEADGFVITFDPNGGSCKTESIYTTSDGTLSVVPEAYRWNYSFDGWFTEKDGGTAVTETTVFTDDAILYAHWTPSRPSTGEQSKKTVYFSISEDGTYISGKDSEKTLMAMVPIEVEWFDLSSYGLSEYQIEENGSVLKQPTVLHLFIRALEKYYLGGETLTVGGDAMTVSGGATSMYFRKFWGHSENITYFFNHQYPLMYEGMGATADYMTLENGDIIEVAMYSSSGFYADENFGFAYFTAEDGKAVESIEVMAGVQQSLVLRSAGADMMNGKRSDRAVSGAQIRSTEDISSAGGNVSAWKSLAVTGSDGSFTFTFAKAGTYVIAAAGSSVSAPGICKVTVLPNPVLDVENKIAAIGTVTLESKPAIDEARAAYNALSNEDKAKVGNYQVLLDKEAAYAVLVDKAAAEAVDNLIEAIGEVEYTADCKAKIDAARTAYEALTEAQKGYVTKYDALAAAEAAYAVLVDKAAAEAVDNLIEAIGEVEYTTDCKAKIDAARTAYEALTEAQKGYVTKYDALAAAEAAYVVLVDKAAAKAVEDMIEAIPGEEDLALADEASIVAARAAYNALTEAQKGYVLNEAKLAAAEARLAELKALAEKEEADRKAAQGVTDMINALPAPVQLEDKAKVEAARAAYDALTEDQKDLIAPEILEKLTNAEAEIVRLEKERDDKAAAAVVEKLIANIGNVTMESKSAIDTARNAYNNLTEEQKAFVSNYQTLLDAEAEYARLLDNAAAKSVEEVIAAIGKVELTEASKAKIDAARAAYDKLTDAQKKLVSNYDVLTAAEEEYQKLLDQKKADEAAAKAVDEAVAKLAPVTLESGKDIEEARKAFDALTPEQKKLLDPETEGKLVAAENEYKKLVKEDADKKAAKEVEEKIASIGTVTKNSGTAIKDARSSYEALTPEQKDLVSKEALKALEEAEKAFARISRINEDSEPIHIIASKGDNKGEKNPNTGAPAMSIAPAMLVLAAAAFVLKKRG